MAPILGALRSTPVRVAFLVLAFGFAVWAVVTQREELGPALSALSWAVLGAALVASLAYVGLTMLAWRVILADLGSTLTLGESSRVFFVSQVGKYLPGGVWNVVAAAEMGTEHAIPRRRSVAVMVVSILVSIVTGMALAGVAVLAGPAEVRESYWWVALTTPFLVASLAPPVLNRILVLALRLTRRPPLEHPLTTRSTLLASGWSVLAWMVAGAQVWMLAVASGLEATPATLALSIGGYALAWTIGFLAVVVPAGVGVREGVLGLVLAGSLGGGGVVVTVLLSRVLLTVADLALGAGAALTMRRRALGGGDTSEGRRRSGASSADEVAE